MLARNVAERIKTILGVLLFIPQHCSHSSAFNRGKGQFMHNTEVPLLNFRPHFGEARYPPAAQQSLHSEFSGFRE